MRDLLGFALIAFGAYWLWNQLEKQEEQLTEAEPTLRDRLRATLEESGVRQTKGEGRIFRRI